MYTDNATPVINNQKIINAWCLYDWANSVYSLVITSAIFPVYYQSVTINAQGGDVINFFGLPIINSVLYSYALSFSFLFVAVILPLLSGMADYGGMKRLFLKIFMYLGAFSCIGLFFFEGDNVEWGIICSVLASVGYSASLVFYDAFLPEIASKDQVDLISAKGYSWGYVGSVILLVVNILMIQFHDRLGFVDEKQATKSTFLMVGIWWILFSQVTFYYLPKNIYRRHPTGNLLTEGYRELLKVWYRLKSLPVMRTYLLAFFFYNMGVQTVMYLAATFGAKELELEAGKLILTILIIQIVAIIGAYAFAHLSRQKGNKFALQVMVTVWIFICLAAYFVQDEYQFYALAFFVGLVMGGIQSLSRATFSKLIPEDSIDHASFFSFYDVTFNLSIVIGTFCYGLIEQMTQSMRNSALILMVFFLSLD